MFVKLPSTGNKYEINEDAIVRKVEDGKIISKYIGIDGYEHIVLFVNGRRVRTRVHRLMAEAYFDNHKPIDHIDMNRANNSLSNLRAISYSENNHKRRELASYKCTNKKTGEVFYARSGRQAERITGVDRHRIKTFVDGTHTNYTDWEFEKV